jgi:hypothetical protein
LRLKNASPEQARVYRQEIRRRVKAHLPGLGRVSFGCYNTEAEVDWFIEVLEWAVRGEVKGHYGQDTASGAFWPEGYAPEMSLYFTL